MESKKNCSSAKKIALYVLLLYLLFTFLPFGIYRLSHWNADGRSQNESAPKAAAADETPPGFLDGLALLPDAPAEAPAAAADDVFRIKDLASDDILQVSARDFLPAALACEMPLSAPDESLKAQAVAIYTYYTRQRTANAQADFDFTCDSGKWLIYVTPEKMQERWGEDCETYRSKAQALTDSVYGQLITENGEPILASYFAISNGSTEASANVWGSERSYLTEVASPGDVLGEGYLSKVTLTPEQLQNSLQAGFPDLSFDFSGAAETWFGEQELSRAGYTKSITAGGQVLEGTEFRTALSLPSTCFDVSFDGGYFVFTVRGHGHGVGMSQAGAMYMAQQGSDYQEILAHYYPGTELTKA